jgi:hypothetical protein
MYSNFSIMESSQLKMQSVILYKLFDLQDSIIAQSGILVLLFGNLQSCLNCNLRASSPILSN